MASVSFDIFAGELPKISDRSLPPQNAVDARNTDLRSGELRGFRKLKVVKDLSSEGTVKTAYRIPATPDDLWLTWNSLDIDVAEAPLVNDLYERYYWTGDGEPKYNSRLRIDNDDPAFDLGVSGATNAATLVVTGGTGSIVTRAYVYTFITEFGEESQPSPPVTKTGPADGSWDLSAMDTTPPNATGRSTVSFKNIYRTVSGADSVDYRYVGQVAAGTTTYSDTVDDATVALNDALQSINWAPPPANLEGLTVMGNGMLAGFVGRDIYFCEPYRPHAWPVQYVQSVDSDIIGLAATGQSLVICTESVPYIGYGVSPSSYSDRRLNRVVPCASKQSITSTEYGVLYASNRGVALVNQNGVKIITEELITENDWEINYTPSGILAAQWGSNYLAFSSANKGLMIGFQEPLSRFVQLDRFDQVTNIYNDQHNGEVYVIRNNVVYEWNPDTTEKLYYTWRSKEFVLPRPLNFGAFRLRMETEAEDIPDDSYSYKLAFNQNRITNPLNTLNLSPLNGVRQETIPNWYEAQNKEPIGGSALFPIGVPTNQTVRINVYANRELKYSNIITDEDIHRLPSGFKHDIWQVELIGNADVYKLQVAETGKELMEV